MAQGSKAQEAHVLTPRVAPALDASWGWASVCQLCSGLGYSQRHAVPRGPLEPFVGLGLRGHLLAEDTFGGGQGARLAGRTQTAPPSRGQRSLPCDPCDPCDCWGCLPRAAVRPLGKF